MESAFLFFFFFLSDPDTVFLKGLYSLNTKIKNAVSYYKKSVCGIKFIVLLNKS